MSELRLRDLGRAALLRTFAPYRRAHELLQAKHREVAELKALLASIDAEKAEREIATASEKAVNKAVEAIENAQAAMLSMQTQLKTQVASHEAREAELRSELATLQVRNNQPQRELGIRISRGDHSGIIDPIWFEVFPFQSGDVLEVVPDQDSASLPVTWGDTNVRVAEGFAIRVPAVWQVFNYKGFKIPVHLITLTGAGPETFEAIGRQHIVHYNRYVGLGSDMTIIDLGCGIGRDAFQLFDDLGPNGRYIGIDVTRDSIVWCQNNITPEHPVFEFHHFDAFSELYNPHGSKSSTEMRFPLEDGSVDRIVLASVFTHLLEDEVLHYLKEFRRVLKPDGLVYANFFLYSPEALNAAKTKGNTAWTATFSHHYGNGVYGNDPTYPRGAVAYSDETMRRLISEAGLRLTRPYLKGWWSGLHDDAEDGQDAAILAL